MKMRSRRRWALGISLAVMVGAAFWMRELASWRPKTFAIVDFVPERIRFSRDGRSLLVKGIGRTQGRIFDLSTGASNSSRENVGNFNQTHGLETYPRVWINWTRHRLIFSAVAGRNITLRGTDFDRFKSRARDEQLRFAWSKSRREVYGAAFGEIYVWNWDDGMPKPKVRYAKKGDDQAVFSPDGKWLIAAQYDKIGNGFLRRYNVQSGEMVALINQWPEFSDCGFSPDGRFFWFVQKGGNFNVLRADNWKWVTGANCEGPVKWLPDNRVGVVQKSGFEWLDVRNSNLYANRRHIPGPSAAVSDWALSSNGKWIYSCEPGKFIRKWRAR